MKSVHKSRRMLRSSIGAMVAMFFAPMVLCAAELTVPESGIFEVTDENNLAENRLDISGDTFSGDGNVELCVNGDVTAFNGNFDWNGEINAYNGTAPLIDYTFVTTNAATICPAVKMDHPHQCTCKFMADGQSDGATSVKLTSFSQSNGSPVIMYVRENQTITAGELAGKVDAVADGNGAALVTSVRH